MPSASPAGSYYGEGMTPAPSTRPGAVALAFVVDAVLVLVFVAIGRRSHTEGITISGVAETGWPFLAALGLGWLVARAWRGPLGIRSPALVIWAATVVGGVALRLVSGQGAQVSFIIVTALVLGLFLLGWRSLTAFVRSRRIGVRRSSSRLR